MKAELCEKVIDVQRKSERVITMVLVFDKVVNKNHMCVCAPGEDQTARKINFILKWLVSGICKALVK